MEPTAGYDPATLALQERRSATLSYVGIKNSPSHLIAARQFGLSCSVFLSAINPRPLEVNLKTLDHCPNKTHAARALSLIHSRFSCLDWCAKPCTPSRYGQCAVSFPTCHSPLSRLLRPALGGERPRLAAILTSCSDGGVPDGSRTRPPGLEGRYSAN